VNRRPESIVVPFPAKRVSVEVERRRAYARFKAAVHDLFRDPTAENAVRYLAVSRAFDESRRAPREPGRELPPAA
jgi:hypothetical protein